MVQAFLMGTQPPDFAQSPAFIILGVIVIPIIAAVIGGLFAIWVYRKQRSRKELSYQIIDDFAFVSVYQEAADQVEIHFRGQPVQEPRIVELRIWNSGNAAVKREDYDAPIKFEFGERTIVGRVRVKTSDNFLEPEEKKTFAKQGVHSIELSKCLLNPGQSVTLVVITAGKGRITGKARIVEGKLIEIDPSKSPLNRTYRFYRFTNLLFFLCCTAWVVYFLYTSPNSYNVYSLSLTYIVEIIIATVFAALFLFRSLFRRKQ